MKAQPAERRLYKRRFADETSTILREDGTAIGECVIENVSEEGAKLGIPSTIGLPDRIILCLFDGTVMPCEVTWRSEGTIGVRFTAPQPASD